MTPEEIRETLFRTLDRLDDLYGDKSNTEDLLRWEREAHEREMANFRAEMEARDKSLAEKERALVEKDCVIAELERRLAESEASRTDSEHKVSSMNRDKFKETSKKCIYKSHITSEGRDDNKDDFDGTLRRAGAN